MCGVFGLFGRALTDEAAQRALEALHHRGPDARGLWRAPATEALATLGHTRLAIVGLRDGAQPLHSEDGQLAAVVNGEWYGWRALRAGLEARGHRFATSTDAEVLLHLYEEHGVACLESLRGEFAFVLYDRRRRRVFAARDRFGVKPLVWTRGEGWLALASEAKALFAAGLTRPRWDMTSLAHALHHQYLPTHRTLFDGVQQLEPGALLLWEDDALTTRRYWTPRLIADPPGLDAAPLHKTLAEAVRLRTEADVPVATCLSGGLDSSAVSALAAAALRDAGRDEPLATFGICFDGFGAAHEVFDERAHAAQVADHIGATYYPRVVRPLELLDALEPAAWHGEGLAINAHLPAKFLLSRHIRDAGYRVVLTGEGADELFAGYPHLRQDLATADGDAHSARAGDAVAESVMVAGALDADEAAALHGAHEAIAAHLGYIPAFLRAKLQLGRRVQQLAHDDLALDPAALLGELLQSAAPELAAAGHPADRSAHLWSQLSLAGYILRTLGDGTEMAHSVEGRTPFLDQHVFHAAARASMRQKIRDGEEKWILREAVRELLPASIARRTKQPFLTPPLLASPAARERVREQLTDAALDTLPLFDLARLRRLLDRVADMPATEQRSLEPALMMALSAASLHKTFHMEAP